MSATRVRRFAELSIRHAGVALGRCSESHFHFLSTLRRFENIWGFVVRGARVRIVLLILPVLIGLLPAGAAASGSQTNSAPTLPPGVTLPPGMTMPSIPQYPVPRQPSESTVPSARTTTAAFPTTSTPTTTGVNRGASTSSTLPPRLLQPTPTTTALAASRPGLLTPQTNLPSIPLAPFHECPALGANTSCGLLIVINPDGSSNVYADDTQGPYDGGDDTLVGIWNNSSHTVNSIPLSSTGAPLFGFDGDGLCTYISCSWPNPTGYEGPNTSFTNISSDSLGGTLTFPNGLASNNTTYFSLEAALTVTPPNDLTTKPHNSARYIALGDSYASGEGASAFDSTTDMAGVDMCHRATNGWAQAVAKVANLGGVDFAACSGALIEDMYSPNVTNGNDDPVAAGNRERAQLDHLNTTTPPELVTLSLGGNNVGFPDVLTDCIVGPPGTPGKKDCAARDARRVRGGTTVNMAIGWLKSGRPAGCHDLPGISQKTGVPEQVCGSAPALHQVYEDILGKMAPDGKLLVLGYPQIFSSKVKKGFLLFSDSSACRVATVNQLGNLHLDISDGDVAWLNDNAFRLNNAVSSEVTQALGWLKIHHMTQTIQYVGVDQEFNGHRVCDDAPWINPLILHFPNPTIFGTPTVDHLSFHPNDSGQAAQAKVMIAKLP